MYSDALKGEENEPREVEECHGGQSCLSLTLTLVLRSFITRSRDRDEPRLDIEPSSLRNFQDMTLAQRNASDKWHAARIAARWRKRGIL